MKKLAILFLLTTVLIGFSFGQVSIKGELELVNITKADESYQGAFDVEEFLSSGALEGAIQPVFKLIFDAAASKELGPGSLTISGEIEYDTVFTNSVGYGDITNASFANAGSAHSIGDHFIQAGYGLPLGPGTLGFYLQWFGIAGADNRLEPGVTYAGLEAGPATLGFGASYRHGFNGLNSDGDERKAFGQIDDYDYDSIAVYVEAAFEFGLYVKYQFRYGTEESKWEDGGTTNIAYLDVNYALLDGALKVGLELDDTHESFKGLTLKPYGSYQLNENVAFGAYLKLRNINGDEDIGGDEISLNPGLWISYTL